MAPGRDARGRTTGWAAVMVAAGLAVSLGVLATALGLSAQEAGAQGATPEAQDGFRASRPGDGEVAGALDRAGTPPARFRSRVRTADGDRFVVTEVRAGDLTLDASRNLRSRVTTSGGHGHKITEGEKQSLPGLCRELEGAYGNLGTPMPPEEDLLVRITCYYAEAPVGYKLTDNIDKPPTQESVEEATNDHYRPPAAGAELAATQPQACNTVMTLTDVTTVRACYVSDNDGIKYLSCSRRKHQLYHDNNSGGHCFRPRAKYTGPCTGNCLGRCGPGCGVGKPNGIYARDCAEHDDCLSDHPNCRGINGNDRCCGDEFDDARGDTILGRFNCDGCNNPRASRAGTGSPGSLERDGPASDPS